MSVKKTTATDAKACKFCKGPMTFLALTLPTWHCSKCNYYWTARPTENAANAFASRMVGKLTFA